MKLGPLSVTISDTGPHLQRISSKIKDAKLTAFSKRNMRHSGYEVSAHQAWTIYRYPPALGMSMVLMWTL
jgi:ATP-dependent helicase YprA (DUF1998 family)